MLETRINTFFINKIFEIVDIQPINRIEKRHLFEDIISIVCEITNEKNTK